MTAAIKARVLAIWLLVIGILWLVIALWVLMVMSGISTPAVTIWLLLIMYFAAPSALTVGSILLIARRGTHVGLLLALAACAWLTWIIGSDLWPRKPENNAIAPMQYDWISFVLALIVVLADVAVIVIWRASRAAPSKIDI